MSRVPLADRTLHSLLSARAQETPTQTALIDAEAGYTYEDLHAAARRFAAGFKSLGVRKGEPVLLMLDNHADFALAWFGLNLAGGVQVPVNTAYKGDMLSHMLRDSGARVLVIEAHYLSVLSEEWESNHAVEKVVVRGTIDPLPPELPITPFEELMSDRDTEPVPVDAWEPMGYLYTSGTTGHSKGVIVPHAQAYTYSMTHWASSDDRIMVNLPLFHIGGQWAGIYTALVSGGSAAIMPRFHASTFWADAARVGCTQTLLIGAMATFLMNQPPAPTDREHTMKRMGMAPVIPRVREFEERFGVVTGSAYGLTESATPILTPYGKTEPGLAGWLRPGFEARIADDHDGEVGLGVVGELLLRTNEPWTTMSGYLGRAAETAATWTNQWLHTGDNMYVDAAGRYFFVDRKKDAIRVKGENVSSFEIESVINQYDAVLESACVAFPSPSTEDDIRAFVVAREGATVRPEALMGYLSDRLPFFMVPRYLEIVPRLPRTSTQRVKKADLRARPLTDTTWDHVAAGYEIKRDRKGLRRHGS